MINKINIKKIISMALSAVLFVPGTTVYSMKQSKHPDLYRQVRSCYYREEEKWREQRKLIMCGIDGVVGYYANGAPICCYGVPTEIHPYIEGSLPLNRKDVGRFIFDLFKELSKDYEEPEPYIKTSVPKFSAQNSEAFVRWFTQLQHTYEEVKSGRSYGILSPFVKMPHFTTYAEARRYITKVSKNIYNILMGRDPESIPGSRPATRFTTGPVNPDDLKRIIYRLSIRIFSVLNDIENFTDIDTFRGNLEYKNFRTLVDALTGQDSKKLAPKTQSQLSAACDLIYLFFSESFGAFLGCDVTSDDIQSERLEHLKREGDCPTAETPTDIAKTAFRLYQGIFYKFLRGQGDLS